MRKVIVAFLTAIILLTVSVSALASGLAFTAETVYQTDTSLTGFSVTFI